MRGIVILGAGTAGTMMSNRLAKQYRREIAEGQMEVTVVDQDRDHIYQPGLLFVPFGSYDPEDLVRNRERTLRDDVSFVSAGVDRVEPGEDRVYLKDGRTLEYDALIIATGTKLVPEETEGLTGEGWREKIFDFYTLEGATALRDALARFEGGNLVVNVVDMPIKCPVAPIEFAFLADWYFRKRRIRERVDLKLVTPLESAFTKPTCSKALSYLLEDKGISLVTEYNTGEVDGPGGKLVSWDDRVVDFDLLVTVPLHAGADFVGRSPGLGDDLNFVLTHPKTLQAEVKENIFALGDATNVATSKAGSVAHFEAEVLTENVRRYLAKAPLGEDFDGHANCFIETGDHKALLVDFNYEVEPLPGKFPLASIGPMSLLKETRLNHWGKLAFKWIYWNMLLPGRDLPLVTTQMTMKGKKPDEAITTCDVPNATHATATAETAAPADSTKVA